MVTVSKLPQQSRFGECELGVEQTFMEYADLTRVEAVEAANGFDAVFVGGDGGLGCHGSVFKQLDRILGDMVDKSN